AAPIVVQGLARVLSSWTGEPYAAPLVTLTALAPVVVAGLVALVRGVTPPWLAWGAAILAAAMFLALTAAPVTAAVCAALGGWIAARGFPLAAARAPVPRRPVAA